MTEIFGENVSTDGTARSVLRKSKWECDVSFARKTVVRIEKQMKQFIFSGQLVQKFFPLTGNSGQSEKKSTNHLQVPHEGNF